jgi:hypothetical protein
MMPWPPRGDEPIEWGDDPVEPPPPPSAGRSLRLGVSAVYDYIGSSLVASLVAFVLFYIALALLFNGLFQLATPRRGPGLALMAVVLLVAPSVLGPFAAGLFTLTRAMFRRDDPHVLDIWRGARRLARPALALGYTQMVVTTVLVSDVVFLLSRSGAAPKVIGVLVAYVTLLWTMMLVYQWPLLVDRGAPLMTTLRNSLVLSLASPFYSLVFALLTLALLIGPNQTFFGFRAGPAVLIPVALVWGALVPSLHTAAALEILRKYDGPPDDEAEGSAP